MKTLFLLFLLLAAAAHAVPHAQPHLRIRAGSAQEAAHIAREVGATLHGPLAVRGYYSATIPDGPHEHPNVRVVHPTEYGLHTAPGEGGWHLDLLGVPPVWNTTTGHGTRVMVIDAAATLAHPDLATVNASLAWNVFANSTDVHSPYGVEHGTSVASVVVGAHDGACASGIAPDADLVFVKLLDLNNGMYITSSVLATTLVHLPPGRVPDVVSLSIGPRVPMYTPLEDVVEDALDTLAARGSLVVWSAGNGAETRDHLAFNAVISHAHVLAVAATDADGEPRPYSTPGGMIALGAPSFVPGEPTPAAAGAADCDMEFGGTSRAAPEVAAIAALLRAAVPDLTPADLLDTLILSAAPRAHNGTANAAGLVHRYDVGFGVPNATLALELATARTERWTPRRVRVPLDLARPVFLRSAAPTANVSVTGRVLAAYFVLDLEMGVCSMAQVRQIEIVSPAGTVASVMHMPNSMYWMRSVSGLRLGTRAFHRESAAGTWTVRIDAQCAFGTEVDDPVLELWVVD